MQSNPEVEMWYGIVLLMWSTTVPWQIIAMEVKTRALYVWLIWLWTDESKVAKRLQIFFSSYHEKKTFTPNYDTMLDPRT